MCGWTSLVIALTHVPSTPYFVKWRASSRCSSTAFLKYRPPFTTALIVATTPRCPRPRRPGPIPFRTAPAQGHNSPARAPGNCPRRPLRLSASPTLKDAEVQALLGPHRTHRSRAWKSAPAPTDAPTKWRCKTIQHPRFPTSFKSCRGRRRVLRHASPGRSMRRTVQVEHGTRPRPNPPPETDAYCDPMDNAQATTSSTGSPARPDWGGKRRCRTISRPWRK